MPEEGRHLIILDKLDCVIAKATLLKAQVTIAGEHLDSPTAERDEFYESVEQQVEATETLVLAQCGNFTTEVSLYDTLFPNPGGGV